MTTKPVHQHGGRRQRKKEQFLKYGIETLPDHEVLEILLYYAIPRSDTNDIAHTLIKKFGSLNNVLDAEYDELKNVSGIGDNAASLICFFRLLSRVYTRNSAEKELIENFNCERLKDYCNTLFFGSKSEEIYCLYLTDDLKLICEERVSMGTIGKVDLPIRKIAHSALVNKCSRLVISHNHPAGSCMPSRADIDATKDVCDMFKKMDVELIDHIIVGRDGVASLKESGYMTGYW
ncbi:MAG: DNA repair protein RadC [Oscillospiraceae bacterium]|nr:DNA repair protein RadC [Oscillospiraceae bacterium]